MAVGPDTLLRYIRGLILRPQADEVSDAALLVRFSTKRDESAFAELVDRHGALVLHVCRRILGDLHDAEDAFQATFLVLARKAATVRRPEALAAWLHGVARRAAIKVRSSRRTRDKILSLQSDNPRLLNADPRSDPLADLSAREFLGIIDEELDRLPEVYRLPVILCCLESRSLEEAARQLGWTVGSVKGRLERGRARLHARLVRRGATLSAALAAAEVSRGAVSAAAIVARLLGGTVRGAAAFAARRPAFAGEVSPAATLAGQLLRDMAVAKLKIVAVILPAMVLLTTGLVLCLASRAPIREAALVRPTPIGGGQPGPVQDEADMPIAVSGRVVDPDGIPITGAKLYVGFSAHRPVPDVQFRPIAFPTRTKSGLDGRFQFTFTKSELDAARLDHSWPAVIAVAEGYGPDWAHIKESAYAAEFNLKLVKDVPVDGRILNHNKEPVAGATLLVWSITSCSEDVLTRVLQGQACLPPDTEWRGPFPGQLPRVTTASDGGFHLTGIGRERIVTFVLEAPGIQRTFLQAATRAPAAVPFPTRCTYLASFEYVAPVVRHIRGVVREKTTGRPIAGVTMTAQSVPSAALASPLTSLTDSTGCYEILVPPEPSGWRLWTQPESGQPYFASSVAVAVKPGPDAITADFDLVSGILVHGRVTDQATRKPPKAAIVEYYPLFPNPHSSKLANYTLGAASSCVVQPDGSYRLAVLPGPGVVCTAASPRDWYAVAHVDEKELAGLVKNGINREFGYDLRTAVGAVEEGIARVSRYHVLSLINPRDGAESPPLDLTLQRARPMKGTVVGRDGEPLAGVTVVGLTASPEDVWLESASFTIWGLNPRSTRNVFFHHGTLGLGKTLTMRGDEAEPLNVQLEPCGSVVGRLVDKSGKPVPGLQLSFNGKDGYLFAGAETDQQGQFRIHLVPGRKYWVGLFPPRPLLRDDQPVVVESAQMKDLGDLHLGD